MELEIYADGDFEEDRYRVPKEDRVEFVFSSPGRMVCPVSGCRGDHFASKQKYQRHWDEKHRFLIFSYPCPEPLCKYFSKRKFDMRRHLRLVHERYGDELEKIVNLVKREVKK